MWTVVLSQNSSEAAWTFLADLLFKITIVLAAGGALVWLMRRRPAAVKHLVWTVSLLSCLLVPGAMLLLPGWGIERAINTGSESVHRIEPVFTSSATSDHAPPSPATSGRYVVDRPGAEFPPSIDRIQPMDSEPVELKLNRGERITANSPLNWLLITWLTGCVIVMLPLIGGIARVAFLCRQSAIVSGKSWGRLVSEISHAIHLRRTVTLRRSHALDISLCGGIIRPFVVLPADSTWWTPERRRLVVLHELAHAKRHDVLVQWVCRLVCAVYWFHPLVWFAARRIRTEQERACDDLVLTAGGATAPVYAEHLVAIAADCRVGRRHAVAAAAFVRHGELESRIRCILQTDRARRPLGVPLRSALLVLLMGGIVSVATAGRVIVRDREGGVVATFRVPEGGTVTIEEPTNDSPTHADDLDELIDAAIESGRERQAYISAERYSPWQIMRLFVPFGREHVLTSNGKVVDAVDYISGGPLYNGERWFQKTPQGGRAHPFTIPYAFEGLPNQFAAWLSAAELPLDHEIQTPDGVICIDDMVEHAKATIDYGVMNGADSEWTLWFLTKYLPQDAEWTNQHGQSWSIETLVRIQVEATVSRAPSGGVPQLYALTLARNARREQTGQLDGVWLEADAKIRQYLNLAKRLQEFDGSLSTPVLYGARRFGDDWNGRIRVTGAVLAWLCIALPREELDADWIRNATRFIATEFDKHRREPMDVATLADGVHGLVAYRRHGGGVGLGEGSTSGRF